MEYFTFEVDGRKVGYYEQNDENGVLYGGDNQHGRSQKFTPKPDADPAHLVGPRYVPPR